MADTLNTYAGWTQQGRQVRVGEKATHYARSPEGRHFGLFHLDQTEEYQGVDPSWPVITAAERDASRPKTLREQGVRGRLKIRIMRVSSPHGKFKLCVWCGSNNEAIRMLKKAGYRFSGTEYRWIAYRDDPDAIVKSLREHQYVVEIDADEREETI